MANKDAVQVPEDGSVQKALAEVRSPSKPAAFVVLGFSAPHNLAVIAEGEGSITEALPHIPDDTERYIMIRKDTKVELAKTVKFVFIAWTPQSIKPMRKAFLSTAFRQIVNLVKPFHVELQISDKKELTEEMILKEIGLSSGTVSRERVSMSGGGPPPVQTGGAAASSSASATSPSPASPKSNTVPHRVSVSNEHKQQQQSNLAKAGAATITLTDEAAFKEALKNIRNDKDQTNWVYSSSAAKASLTLLGSGSGGVTEMAAKFEDDIPGFGLLRVTEVMDSKAKSTKFVYVIWQPETTKIMKKAELSAFKGAIESLFRPYHVELFVQKKADLTEKAVMDAVSSASGSKSHVVDGGNRSSNISSDIARAYFK